MKIEWKKSKNKMKSIRADKFIWCKPFNFRATNSISMNMVYGVCVVGDWRFDIDSLSGLACFYLCNKHEWSGWCTNLYILNLPNWMSVRKKNPCSRSLAHFYRKSLFLFFHFCLAVHSTSLKWKLVCAQI